MKLDRNAKGQNKYALIKMRALELTLDPLSTSLSQARREKIREAMLTLEHAGVLEYGEPWSEREFFVVMLRDECAQAALVGYGMAAMSFDPEYAGEVEELAKRAGPSSPFCKRPD